MITGILLHCTLVPRDKVRAPPLSQHHWLSRLALTETDKSFPECALASKVDNWILFEARKYGTKICPRLVSDVRTRTAKHKSFRPPSPYNNLHHGVTRLAYWWLRGAHAACARCLTRPADTLSRVHSDNDGLFNQFQLRSFAR